MLSLTKILKQQCQISWIDLVFLPVFLGGMAAYGFTQHYLLLLLAQSGLFLLFRVSYSFSSAFCQLFLFQFFFHMVGTWWVSRPMLHMDIIPIFWGGILSFTLWLTASLFYFPILYYRYLRSGWWMLPCLWACAEALKLFLFPFLLIGFSQTPGFLSGYAPIGGVLMVGMIHSLSANILASLVCIDSQLDQMKGIILLIIIVVLNQFLSHYQWVKLSGEISVSVVQTSIDMKKNSA